jgi:hypothetical protein
VAFDPRLVARPLPNSVPAVDPRFVSVTVGAPRAVGGSVEFSRSMEDLVARILADLIHRGTGPFSLRLVLQPTVAAILAIRDGMKDVDAGRPPYLWSIYRHPLERGRLLREGWRSIARVYGLAVLFDLVFQVVVLRWIYVGEALVVATFLAVVPYACLRGPANRLVRLVRRRRAARQGE